jgi:Na+/melibiose symporter-like transporter
VYFQRQTKGWRKGVQAAGSALLVVSPALLISAFALEPQHGFQEHMRWSVAGLFTLFLGCLAHFACGAPPQTKYSR